MSLLALVVVAWCFSGRPSAPLAQPESAEVVEPMVAPLLPPQAKPAPAKLLPDEVPIRPAGSDEVDGVGMQPHPITPEHQRIFRENNLIGDLNGAMDVADVAGLRGLLQQYRNEYPEDSHVLQDGYELIANCLERLSPETRATAQRYYDEALDSGLRRYIRRHCLEASNP